MQARLCSFQCFFWHGRPQYQARWHCEQHIILVLSVWQWKQRWVSSGGAAASLPFPFLPVVPLVPFLVVLVGVELLVLLAAAAAEASVGGLSPCDAASDAARAPSAVFGGMVCCTT